MNTQDITQEQITEARDWASDCLGMVAETVTINRALKYITANYPGGWDAFVAEVCTPALPTATAVPEITYRWIMYVSQNVPGNISFGLTRETSLESARQAYVDYCRAVGTDECSASLYAYSDDAWKDAEDFRDTGCPFDYPARIIERGPMGGIRVQNT